MTEKTVFVSLPVSVAVDAVQLRLQVLADDLRIQYGSVEPPSSEELNRVASELIGLALIMKEVEKKGSAE